MTTINRISLSVHPRIKGKNETGENIGYGWITKRRSIAEIRDHLKSGAALCVATLKSNHREDDGFMSSQLMALDFDEGPGVAHFVEKDEFCKQYAALVMSTTNSTPEKPRTRVYFLLDKVITDGNEYKTLLINLMARLSYPGVDPIAKSCTQIFYGNENAEIVINETAILTLEVLKALPSAKSVAQLAKSIGQEIDVRIGGDKESIPDLLSRPVDKGERDNTALRLVGKYANVLPPEEIKTILKMWYDIKVTDQQDFPFSVIEDMITRFSDKSAEVRARVNKTIIEAVEGKTAPQPAFKEALGKLTTSFADMMSADDTHGNWLIQNWLPEATTALMVAPPGHFKTWLALSMAMAIGMGRPFLESFATSDIMHPVLFMQQEDSRSIIKQRSSLIWGEYSSMDSPAIWQDNPPEDGYNLEMEIRNPKIHYWTSPETFRLDNDQSIQNLRALILDLKLRAIFIDPLYAITDSNDYMSKDAQRMVEFKRMRDKTGCSFIILHHTKKSALPAQGPGSGKPQRLDSWGSQFLNAWLETGIQIRSTPIQNTVSIMRHFKSAGDTFMDTFSFDINTDEEKGDKHFKVTSEKVVDKAKVDVIQLFEKHGAMSVSDFSKRSGIALSTASRQLSKLLDKGVIMRNEKGLYVLVTVDFSD